MCKHNTPWVMCFLCLNKSKVIVKWLKKQNPSLLPNHLLQPFWGNTKVTYNLTSMSWVCPRASSGCDIPKTPQPGGARRHSQMPKLPQLAHFDVERVVWSWVGNQTKSNSKSPMSRRSREPFTWMNNYTGRTDSSQAWGGYPTVSVWWLGLSPWSLSGHSLKKEHRPTLM